MVGGGDAEAERFTSDVALLNVRTWQWHAAALKVPLGSVSEDLSSSLLCVCVCHAK